MYNLFTYIDISDYSSRKKIEDFSKKYKIIEASFFGARWNDTSLIDEICPELLRLSKLKLINNFSSDILHEGQLKKYIANRKLNIKMNIPLNSIEFNKDVFSYYGSESEIDSDQEESIDDFQSGDDTETLNIYERSEQDFDNGKANCTVTFPKEFPLFNNTEDKTFVLYQGEICYQYDRKDISDVIKSQEFNLLNLRYQIESLEQLKEKIEEMGKKRTTSGVRVKDTNHYKKYKESLEKKLNKLKEQISDTNKVTKLKYLTLKHVEENIEAILKKEHKVKTLEEYLEIFNTEFYILMRIGQDSFITLKLKEIKDKNLKRKKTDVDNVISTGKKTKKELSRVSRGDQAGTSGV